MPEAKDTVVPKAFRALSRSPAPRLREMMDAPPAPAMTAMAPASSCRGKHMATAASPGEPTPLPMKMASTTL